MNAASEPPSGSASPSSRHRSSSRLKWAGRILLFSVGVFALVGMINQIGAESIRDAMVRTAVWLPLIFALDLSWVLLEGGALLTLYGEERRKIPVGAWLRISLVHFATFMLFPMGRASAEVARAALVKKYIDRDLAIVGAALMQSLTMMGNGLASLVAATFLIALSRSHTLMLALLANAALLVGLGIASYLVLRHGKVGGFLAKRFARLARAGPGFDRQFSLTKNKHAWGLLFCLLGRCLQTTQYGVILLAVTGESSIHRAWIAEGLQMAARSVGDFIPNQMGVTEGAFVYFRAALDLANASALAMTVALVARISNFSVAALSMICAQFWPQSDHRRQAPLASE